MDNDEIKILIDDCIKREKKLTVWEQNFIADMQKILNKKFNFSERQLAIINGIWERVT